MKASSWWLCGVAAAGVGCGSDGGGASAPALTAIAGCGEVESPRIDARDDVVLLGMDPLAEAELNGLAASGGLAVTCDALYGVGVYDVCDPTAPRRTATLPNVRCLGATLAPPFLYATTAARGATGETSIAIFDLSDPAQPREVTTYRTTGVAFEQVVAHEGHLYAASHGAGVQIFRIREDGALRPAGSVHEDLDERDAWNLAVHGGRLYVSDNVHGLRVFDLTDPAAPAPLGTLVPGSETDRPERVQGRAVAVKDGVAFLAMAGDGVGVLDVSGEAPTWVGRIHTRRPVFDLDVAGDNLYLAAWSDLRIYDVSAPRQPELIATEDPQDDFPRVLGVQIADGRVYVAEWKSLRIYRHLEGRAAADLRLGIDREIVFQKTPPGEADAMVLAIANDGRRTLKISRIASDNPHFVPQLERLEVAPGAEIPVEIHFQPTDSELQLGTLTVSSNDPDEGEMRLALRANDAAASLGTPAPPFDLQDIEGGTHTPQDYRGKVLVMVFFSTTCGTCGYELPDIDESVARRYGDRGVEVLAVTEASRDTIRHYKTRIRYNYPTLLDLDPLGAVYSAYAALEPGIGGSVPLNFVIDRDGNVAYSSAGYDPAAIIEVIEAAIAR